MACQHTERTEFDAPLRRQGPHPGPMVFVRMRQGVVVAELGEVIVSRVGVAALAIGKGVADRLVVVALDRDHVRRTQQFQ